jgi:uncharacterized protein (DUF58 family)
VLIAMARLLGLPELFLSGTACLVLLAGALAYAQLVPVSLRAERRLLPGRVHLQRESRVELTLTNRGRWASPVLSARDHFGGGRRATTFVVGPLRPSERTTARYWLFAERRGVFDVGPLELELRDPFGLAERRVMAAPRSRLVVFPRVEALVLGVGQGDEDLQADPPLASLLGRHGDELYSLRPYAVGDDLRRVHWPSTAHRDELMIRQDQRPGQGGLTVLLDLRRQVHTGASAERAISVAASVAVAASRAGQALGLVTTERHGAGSTKGRGQHGHEHRPAQLPQLLERLAAAGPSSSGFAEALAVVAGSRARRRQLVAITTSAADPADLRALYGLGRQFGAAVVVVVEPVMMETGSGAPAPGAMGPRGPGPSALPAVRVVTVRAGQPLAAAWEAVPRLSSTRGQAGVRRRPAPVPPT